MLVLSRKESERIRVGDSIVVTVVRLTKDRVRLGIEAPDDVLVLRDELEKDGEFAPSGEEKEPLRKEVPERSLKSMVRRMRQENLAAESESGAVATEESVEEKNTRRRCPDRKYFRW
ncbi:MAG: carbon storage regulator [Planctomycetia bacterium]|nr:carbon storage regulator [Planctomycetia bacterium]